MKLSVMLLIVCFIAKGAKAQKVITLTPNSEVKTFSNADLKHHADMDVEGNRMTYSDSGQLLSECYIKHGRINGYSKLYRNGILVELGLYTDSRPVGTHYFWDETGILKKSITYKEGKEVAVKQY